MAAKKRVDPIKQREKRAKIAAAGGCVLLLAVAAFEVPKMMALMNKKPPVAATSTAPTTSGATGLPDVSGTAAPTTTTPAGELADTDIPPVAASGAGQLVSFDVFETKDPFRPQVTASDQNPTPAENPDSSTPATPQTTEPATSTVPASTAPAGAVPATTPPVSMTPTETPADPAASTTPTETTPATPVAPTVAISVNGTVSRVGRNGTFPSATPVFRLVSWTKTEARIGIVGGSYSTGDPTLGLKIGKSVTLQNTSDGQRYKLTLVSTP